MVYSEFRTVMLDAELIALIHHLFQVDWPVTCEENLDESSSLLYRHSGEIYEDLKARVPFPNDTIESLQKDLQMLQIKLNLQNSVFSQESAAPAGWARLFNASGLHTVCADHLAESKRTDRL